MTAQVVEAAEAQGNFETDYVKACEKLSQNGFIKPMQVVRLVREDFALKKPKKETDVQEEATQKSRYRYTPTIQLCLWNEETKEEKLSVSGWKLDTIHMEAISLNLPICQTITYLNFYNCGMTESHFNILLNVLPSSYVTSLAIDQNPLIPETLFSLIITEDSFIKGLSLRANGITCTGAKLIATSLRSNHSLIHLNLWKNNISTIGVEAFSDMLKTNQTLVSLSLAYNPIGDEGTNLLSKALCNTVLASDELGSKKKIIAELDKIRREQEESEGKKGGKVGGRGTPGQKKTPNAPKAGIKSAGLTEEEKDKAGGTVDSKKKGLPKNKADPKAKDAPKALGKKGAVVAGSNSTLADDSKDFKSKKVEAKKGDKKGKKGEKIKEEVKEEVEEV